MNPGGPKPGKQTQMSNFFPASGQGKASKTPVSVGKGQMKISSFFKTPGSQGAATATPQSQGAQTGATPKTQPQGTKAAPGGTPAGPSAAKTAPSQTPAPTPAPAEGEPQKTAYAVGQRVKVYWPGESAWYTGTVKVYRAEDNKHQVLYDDGDEAWEDLAKERVQLTTTPAPTHNSNTAAKGKAGTGAANSGKGAKAQQQRVIGQAVTTECDPLEDEDVEMSDAKAEEPPSASAGTRRRLVRNASQKTSVKKQASLEDSGSEFSGGAPSDDSDDESVDLEPEESDGDGSAASDEGDASDEDTGTGAGKGKKRRRASTKHTPAPKAKKGGAAATPGSAAPATATPAARSASLTSGAPATSGRQPSHTPSFSHTTPVAGAKTKLQRSLDVTPATAQSSKQGEVKEVVHGVETKLSNEDAGRFLSRMAQRFPFLHPSKIMDACKRKATHPDYDPSTLYIPETWFKEMKISEGQQQWWTFKAKNFDSVLLFKMGKFYEMFEMDAYVGVDVLGLQFMKGEQPHAGFPEVRYHDMAEALARAGYRVVVVEQTETPEQLAKRNEERKAQRLKQAGVVNREKVAVVSKGTMIDAEMVASKPDPSYVMALAEVPVPSPQSDPTQVTCVGLAAVDVASGHVLVGEFCDDEVRSSLRTHLTAIQPVELVLPSKQAASAETAQGAPRVDPVTMRILKTALRDPRVNAGKRENGWTPQRLLQLCQERRYFKRKEGDATATPATTPGQSFAAWPPVLGALAQTWLDKQGTDADMTPANDTDNPDTQTTRVQAAAGGVAALSALCGLVDFLKDSLLDLAVLPQGRVEALPALQRASSSQVTQLGSDEPTHMLLNGAALESLEILENTEGGVVGSLLSVVDSCGTPFGRRRLRTWLCRPLYRAKDITRRQDAVEALQSACDAVGDARRHLAGVSDLERAVARLYSSTVAGASGRDASNVVLYEDAAKRKVKALTSALRDLQSVCKAAQSLRKAAESSSTDSELLTQLTDTDKWSEVESSLSALNSATDWRQAEATGRVVPAEGVHEGYDAALQRVKDVEGELAEYLREVRGKVSGARERDIQYVSMNKDSHVIEVPEAAKVPSSFTLVGQRKGYKKYSSATLRQLVADLAEAEQGKEDALAGILQDLVVRFCDQRDLWRWAVDAVADLDALMSLASHAANAEGVMCRPEILPGSATDPPVLSARGLRHPAGLAGRSGAFVPNDIMLGGADAPAFIVLSGPNMGGKSTLLRQACLAAVLAQIGACVPAESMTLTPVDAVFVRMGAKDSIMTGQSTFYVELAETAAMLNKATSRSLVALDELGRGTATLDGAAIASAVLDHMAHAVGCRGLFATHYHHLSHHHAQDPKIAIMHMACAVGGEEEEGGDEPMQDATHTNTQAVDAVPEVTFLYKLTPGACPKSYGTNVARLAGLPASVVERAARMSEATEGQVQAVVGATQPVAAALRRTVETVKSACAQMEPSEAQRLLESACADATKAVA